MNESDSRFHEIKLIIAADHRCGEIDPQNDQIWELNTFRGEPPGVTLQTTFGLQAYGMRVYPRFLFKKIPISDPHTFAIRPVLEFSAPNFISLSYSPVSAIDVIQKVWVPDSHTLVGQVTFTNTTAAMLQFGMEWVVLLHPLLAGSSMTCSQISVNTILQGQTQHLFPVFFLTGGPQGNLSAFPSLGIELSLAPNASRQFSWALSSLDSTDASFYCARKSTAYSLDNEQIKIEMLQKEQTIEFDFGNARIDKTLRDCQQRAFQLLVPPHRDFNHLSYVTNRVPDLGFNPSERGRDFSSGWGVQRIHEIWAISRVLLPLRPDIVKELVQNLLDQQGDDGTIYAQTSWNGNITTLPAAPLLVSLALDIFDFTDDMEWLLQTFPALLRSIRVWFEPQQDHDLDGCPLWRHLLQTGIAESTVLGDPLKTNLDILVDTAEWPSLSALLVQECQGLIKIAGLLNDTSEIVWLEKQIQQLQTMLQSCWDEKSAFYHYRDKENHTINKSMILHTFKQNGSSNGTNLFPNAVRLCVKVHTKDGVMRGIECQIKGIVNHHEKTATIFAKKFHWEDEFAFAISDEFFSSVKQISVSGLKNGDRVTVETPDFTLKGPDFLIPLWAGIPSDEQAKNMILRGTEYLDALKSEIPNFLKFMWLEGLNKYHHKELACQYFQKWFFEQTPGSTKSPGSSVLEHDYLSGLTLHELPPLRTLLQLLGLQKITEDEILIKDFNDFFPKVNVQYKRFLFVLETAQIKIQNLNGESVLITEPGSHRIVLS